MEKIDVAKDRLFPLKAEPLYTVINKEDDEYVTVDLMTQGGFVQIKMESEGVVVDMWCQRDDGSEDCIGTMMLSYEELRGEE
tara:strand:+ start:1824 stop:2069 length:246 start_codon:yes stop_codon:yes gene_type:complete